LPLSGCRELGEPRQGNILVEPGLPADGGGEGCKAVGSGGLLALLVQLAQALLLAEPVELGGDDRGGGLVGRPGELA
jgi:hypothetical protein